MCPGRSRLPGGTLAPTLRGRVFSRPDYFGPLTADGNYDLLVPLMLAQGVAFVALRRQSLYRSQVATQRQSPAYRDAVLPAEARQDLMFVSSGTRRMWPLRNVGAQADCHLRRMRASHTTAENHDLRRLHARHAAEQNPEATLRLLQAALVPLFVLVLRPFIKILSTPQRAARVITQILTDASGQTDIYYDEGGHPMQGSVLVRDPRFQDRVVAETRALLATIPTRA